MKHLIIGLFALGSMSVFGMNCTKADKVMRDVEQRFEQVSSNGKISKSDMRTITLAMIGINFRVDNDLASCSSYLSDAKALGETLEKLAMP